MSLHKEIEFETEICEHLAANGWLYAEGDYAKYNRKKALFPPDLIDWIQASQPGAWEALSRNHGDQAETIFLHRMHAQLTQRTLDVLRRGIELIGLKQPLSLAQFKPAVAMNPETMARYEANWLRVVRHVDDHEAGRPQIR